MKSRIVTIRNRAGIHCRPSGVILNTIKQEFPYHEFSLTAEDGGMVELDSILSLISLGLAAGNSAELRVEGPDEAKAIEKIGDLFEYEFDFPSREKK